MNTISDIKPNMDNYKLDEIGCFEKPFGIVLESYEERYSSAFYMFLKFYQSYNTERYPFGTVTSFNDRMQIGIDIINEIFNIKCENINPQGNIHEFIQNKLMLNTPVLVPGNLKECYYATQHKVSDHAHLYIIKGFDKDKRKYFILDSTHIKGEGYKYDDFFVEEDALESLYKSCCKDMDINYMYCFSSQTSKSSVSIDDIVLKCINIYENNLAKQPYKEIDYINVVVSLIQNNNNLNSSFSEEKEDVKKEYTVEGFLMEMKNTIKFKNIFLSELITNLSLYISDNNFLNNLVERKSSVIKKWNEIVDLAIACLYRGKLFDLSKEFGEAIKIEEQLRSLISEAKSMLLNLNKNYEEVNKHDNSIVLMDSKMIPQPEFDFNVKAEYEKGRN